MKKAIASGFPNELIELCSMVRELSNQHNYERGETLVRSAMAKYPHGPQPHNLLGLLLEMRNDHLTAMKHFRAAYALDPT